MKTKKNETLIFKGKMQKHNGRRGDPTIILQKHLGNRNWTRAPLKWRLKSSKGKMNTKKQKSEKTVCFSREKFFEYINEDLKKWNPLF